MTGDNKNNRTSNVSELSLGMLFGGLALMALGSRVRLLAALPLWLAGTTLAAGGASMRPEATKLASGIAPEDSLWVKLKSSVSVMRPTAEIYEYWRNPLNWPQFMPDIEVASVGTDRYELIKNVAPGVSLKQQFMIIEDLPYHRIAWVSLGEELPYRGSVEFTTNGGTYVTLTWEYKLATGPAINMMSKQTFRSLNEVLLVKLQRLKQILETGSATIFGATGCRGTSVQLLWYVWKTDAHRAFADLAEPATSEAS
jgi:uncharacterized membrane protein